MNSEAQFLFTRMRSALRTLLRDVVLVYFGKKYALFKTHPLQNVDELTKASIGTHFAQHPSLPGTEVDVFYKHHPRTIAQVMSGP